MNIFTQEEFEKAYKSLLDLILKIEKAMVERNSKALEKLLVIFEEKASKLDDGNSSQIAGFKEDILAKVSKALTEQENGMNYIRDYIRNLKNGKDGRDADEARVVQEVLSQIKLPEQKEIILDTPIEIRNKLESIDNESEKLAIEAIKDLRKELDELRELKTQRMGGGGFSSIAFQSKFIDDEVPTNNGDDLNFTISHTPTPATSLKVYLNGQKLTLTTDYTFTNKTITLLSALLATDTLLVDYRVM